MLLQPIYYYLLSPLPCSILFFFFFFNDTATTEIYTLSLHDALPIFGPASLSAAATTTGCRLPPLYSMRTSRDRKSTRLNSSHVEISYAVFCLKKKKKQKRRIHAV